MTEPVHFDSTDIDRVESFVSSIYSSMRIGAVGETTRARITRNFLDDQIEFNDLNYTFDIEYNAAPPDRLIICDIITNTIHKDSRATEADEDIFGPGDQFLISRPKIPYSGIAHATKLRFTLLDPAILARVAAEDDLAAPVRVLDHRPISRQRQLQLQRCITYIRTSVLATAETASAPLLTSAAGQFLAATVLHTYPNTAITDPSSPDRNDANLPTLERATAFIEANPDQPLTLADIARAAHVSPRALQLAFSRHLHTSPTAYLRRVRLEHARNQLQTATAGDNTTVTDVAARWGFTPSRFTRQYQSTYHELPSQTLHK